VVLPKFGKHVPLGVSRVAHASTSFSSVTHAGAKPIAAYHRKLAIVTVRIYHHGSLDGEITDW